MNKGNDIQFELSIGFSIYLQFIFVFLILHLRFGLSISDMKSTEIDDLFHFNDSY